MAEPQSPTATPTTPAYAPAMRPEFFERTPRAEAITRCQKYFDSTQYDGRPDFWSADDIPLRKRKPCTIVNIGQAATKELVRFTYGEGRFPALSVKPVEAKDAIAGLEVSKDNAELLEATLTECVKQTRLEPAMRSLTATGISCRTAVGIVSIRDGRFVVDQPRPQHCWPKFKRDGDPTSPVVGMTWCYAYDRLVLNERTGEPEVVAHYFRRDITETEYIDFEPARISPDVAKIEWRESTRTPHPFGVCPVVWHRNLADPHCGDMDGTSIFDAGRLDNIDALNLSYSQRHRGIFTLGVPQPWETGVEPGDGPGATGKTATPGYSSAAERKRRVASGGNPARKMSPTEVWRYESEKVQLGLLETTGKAFEVASKHVDDIAGRLKQEMGVTLANAADVLGKGDMSAKFLALAYAPELAFVDEIRTDSWAHCLRPLLELMLRGIMATRGVGLLFARAADVAAMLAKRIVKTIDGDLWLAPVIEPLWGAYFSPSNEDIKIAVEAVSSAVTAKVLPPREGVTYLASYFGIRDVDDALERLGVVEPKLGKSAAADDAALVEPDPAADPASDSPTTGGKIVLAPTDQATIVRVDEARAALSLPSFGEDGQLTIAAFKAKHADVVASSAAADAGKTQAVDPAEEARLKAEAAKHAPPPFGGAPHPPPDPNAPAPGSKPGDPPPKD